MNSIEKTGKTIEEALANALEELNTTIDNVEYEILEKGTRGIFGFGSKPAIIKVSLNFDPQGAAKNFLREIFICMGIIVDFTITESDKRLEINLEGENMGIIIGKRGQTLNALQYLVNLAVNKGNAPYVNIILDAENYRARRKETLEKLAHNLARKVKSTKKEVKLEPMNPYERRIIHAALQNDKTINTSSRGEDPYRYVVISNKK